MSNSKQASLVIVLGEKSDARIYIGSKEIIGFTPYTRNEIREIYRNCLTMLELQNKFGVGPKLVRKVLKLAKIQYLKDLIAEYRGGLSWGQIARKHGMKLATLTSLIKAQGYEVLAGCRRPKIPKPKLKRSFEKHRIVAHVAADFQIHWQTAYNALKTAGLTPPPIRRRNKPP